MKTLIILLLLAVLVAIVVLVVSVARWGQRSYQRYSGLEHQRASAKQSRDAGVVRLKDANGCLVGTQRTLIARGDHSGAQDVERLRSRLSTMADRTRFATHGYAPLGSPNPVREEELVELQAHDAETITDTQLITDLCRQLVLPGCGGCVQIADAHQQRDLGSAVFRRRVFVATPSYTQLRSAPATSDRADSGTDESVLSQSVQRGHQRWGRFDSHRSLHHPRTGQARRCRRRGLGDCEVEAVVRRDCLVGCGCACSDGVSSARGARLKHGKAGCNGDRCN
ncbi:MAG: hypothetical protein ABSH36_14270 [Solirubrobacteraceae bacterium]